MKRVLLVCESAVAFTREMSIRRVCPSDVVIEFTHHGSANKAQECYIAHRVDMPFDVVAVDSEIKPWSSDNVTSSSTTVALVRNLVSSYGATCVVLGNQRSLDTLLAILTAKPATEDGPSVPVVKYDGNVWLTLNPRVTIMGGVHSIDGFEQYGARNILIRNAKVSVGTVVRIQVGKQITFFHRSTFDDVQQARQEVPRS